MNSSPCAKLTTSMMPKIKVRPEATKARIMPVTMPLIVWIRIWSSGISMSHAEILVNHRVVDLQFRGQGVMTHNALLDEINSPARFEGQRDILLDQEDRDPLAAQHADDFQDLRHHARHQALGRLVQEDDLGFEHHRPGDDARTQDHHSPGDRQHLLLTARERTASL